MMDLFMPDLRFALDLEWCVGVLCGGEMWLQRVQDGLNVVLKYAYLS